MGVIKSDLKALVVDDHQLIRSVLEDYLRGQGVCHIDFASNSDEVEVKIAPDKYDIVFMDWVLPSKSGYGLMQSLRENRAYDKTAFVMVTARVEEHDKRGAEKAGANAYLCKPLNRQEFDAAFETVTGWLDRVHALEASKSG